MSIRFRRSMKLMPGVRLNFNKDSVGMSFGVPGARYTVNSKGRRTASVGIPGTGLYNIETLSSGRSKRSGGGNSKVAQAAVESASGPPKPSLFAGKAEKELNAFLIDIYDPESTDDATSVINKAVALREKFEDLRVPLELISFLHGITDAKWKEKARGWGEGLWQNRGSVFADPLVAKYFKGIHPQVRISPGISSQLTYDAQTLGFIWAEVLQGEKKFDEALNVLSEMSPDQMVAISIADIEIEKGDFDGAIETTEDVEIFDDATAMLMVLRGVSFRGKGMLEAAIECFKRVLKEKGLPEALMHRALFERGVTYGQMGKKAMGIKDLERILVDDPNYPEVQEKLAELKK